MGFSEAEAQWIAEYSEFVDDFNWIKNVKATNIPPDIVSSTRYDMYAGDNEFDPVTSGFTSILDYALLLMYRAQRFYILLFHFIPNFRDDLEKDKVACTSPARIGDGLLISQALGKAQDTFKSHTEPADRLIDLMRIGMLLHTFADTILTLTK